MRTALSVLEEHLPTRLLPRLRASVALGPQPGPRLLRPSTGGLPSPESLWEPS